MPNDNKDNELMVRIALCLVAMFMVTTLAFCAPEPSINPTVASVQEGYED